MKTSLMSKAFYISLIVTASVLCAALTGQCYADQTGTVVCDSGPEYVEVLGDPDPEGTSRYASKRIMVFAEEGALKDTYGAVDSVYYTAAEHYILEYDSPSDTKAAYKALIEDFGNDKVFVDQLFGLDSVPSQTETNETTASSVSYGNDLMYLDIARDEYEDELQLDDPVIVAVIDSGINRTHEMFTYTYYNGNKESRLILHEDAYFAGKSIDDISGHGTHVAGIIADGTSHQIKIMPVRAIEDRYFTSSGLYDALMYARDHGADVINMSLGFFNETDELRELFEPVFKEFREKDGIMCVASAGNDQREPNYPSTSHYVESVSALKYENGKLEFDYGYSNYGSAVTFAAPGTDVKSAYIGSDTAYETLSGTSMACPHISAAMAMVKFRNPDYIPSEMISILQEMVYQSADTLSAGKYYYQDGYGMPAFSDDFWRVPFIYSIRNYTFKLKQKTFTYNGKKDYVPEVEEEATYLAPVSWTESGTYLYTAKLDEDFVYYSYSDGDTVGTAVLGLRGLYPELTGVKYISYTILPKGAVLTKPKAGKKKITVKWKRQTMKMSTNRINGYEIQIARNKKFTKGKKTLKAAGYRQTSKVFKKLKSGKKYYIRIRTYMKVRGKTYRSKWSALRTATAK